MLCLLWYLVSISIRYGLFTDLQNQPAHAGATGCVKREYVTHDFKDSKCSKGFRGSKGSKGFRGSKGSKGFRGSKGSKGFRGSKGWFIGSDRDTDR